MSVGDSKDLLKNIEKHFEGKESLLNKKKENQQTKETKTEKRKSSSDSDSSKKSPKSSNINCNDNLTEGDMSIDSESISTKQKQGDHQMKYDISYIINNTKSKDKNAFIPITLPFLSKEDTAKSLIEENKLYIMQFPRIIPVNLEGQIKTKEEENINEEPIHDSNGFLISPEFKNSFKELNKNIKFGKLKFYKSGKVKLQIGDVLFDVTKGTNNKFAQEIAVITGEGSDEAIMLGEPESEKLLVTPEIS